MQNATLINQEQLTPSLFTFWLEPQHPVSYQPGQSITVSLPHDKRDNRGDTRWFSISSAPNERYLAFTTNLAAGTAASSFKQQLRKLQPGDSLSIATQASGDFILPRNPQIPLVFIAGGVGAAPLRSIIIHLLASGEQRTIDMFFTAKTSGDLAFIQLFRSYCRSTHIYTTASDANQPGEPVRLSGTAIVQSLDQPVIRDGLYFIAGPEQFVESTKDDLLANGIAQRQLVLDQFHNYDTV